MWKYKSIKTYYYGVLFYMYLCIYILTMQNIIFKICTTKWAPFITYIIYKNSMLGPHNWRADRLRCSNDSTTVYVSLSTT